MSRTRSTFLPAFALFVAAGSVPAAAQTRVEVVAKPRASVEGDAQFRRLQRQLDSLAQRYSDEEISNSDRKRLEVEMRRAVFQLQDLMERAGAEARSRVLLHAATTPQSLTLPRGWIGIVVEGPGMEPRIEN